VVNNDKIALAVEKCLPGRTVKTIIDKGVCIKHNYKIILDQDGIIFLKLKVYPRGGDIKHEAKVADMLCEQGLSEPRVLTVDESCSILPYPYLIQEQMPGEKLGTLLLQENEKEIEKIYEAIGQYYRRMHSIKNDTSGLISDNPRKLLYPVSPNDYMFNAEIVNGSSKKALEKGLISENTYKRAVSLWMNNLNYLKNHQPCLVHVSPFIWNIYLSKKDNDWHVTKITALGDVMWWDPAYDLALLQYPSFGNYVSSRWDAFLKGYGSIPERKRMLLYSIMHRLCAAIGTYMEPKLKDKEQWKFDCLSGMVALMDEIESLG
jgi:hypothetical protein